MDWSTPGFTVLHYLLEFTQSHVHWVSDASQLSHPLVPFSSCPQSFPAWPSYPMSWLFTLGGQSIGASVSATVFGVNIQGWFSFRLTGLITLQRKGLSRSLLQHHNSKKSILWHSTFFIVQLWHSHMTTRKTIALTTWTSVGKVMPLLFNTLRLFLQEASVF